MRKRLWAGICVTAAAVTAFLFLAAPWVFAHSANVHGVTHCDGSVTWTASNDFGQDATVFVQGQSNENLPAHGTVSFSGPDTISTRVVWTDGFTQPHEGYQTWNASPSHDCETTTTSTVPVTTVPQTTVPVTTVPRTTVPVTHPPTSTPTTVKAQVDRTTIKCSDITPDHPANSCTLPATGSNIGWIVVTGVVLVAVGLFFASRLGDAVGERFHK